MNRRFKVQSNSNRDLYYIVQEVDNKLECDCPAGSRDKDCNHKNIVGKFLGRQHLELKNLERIKEI